MKRQTKIHKEPDIPCLNTSVTLGKYNAIATCDSDTQDFKMQCFTLVAGAGGLIKIHLPY